VLRDFYRFKFYHYPDGRLRMKKRRISIQIYSDFEHLNSIEELRNLSLYFGNLFEFYLPTYYTNIRKVVIELVNESDLLLIIRDDMSSGVCTILKGFNFSQFDLVNTKLRKNYYLILYLTV